MNTKLIAIIVGIVVLAAVLWYLFARGPLSGFDLMKTLGSKKFAVASAEVEYYQGTRGFYAAPKEAGKYPGVVMMHEWWGLNDTIKESASMLAAEGYQVLAVDLHQGAVATTTDEARKLVGSVPQEERTKNMQAAVRYLRDHGAPKVASLGWCFGGGQSLQLAISGTNLHGTVLYYGTVVTSTEKLAMIKWPVLGIFGGKDTSIPAANVEAFEHALATEDVPSTIITYPNVGHAFANPTGQNYAPEETRAAWERTLRFLEANLKPTQAEEGS